MGAMGIAPPLFDGYLKKYGLRNESHIIQTLCDRILARTVSRIKEWLDLHHARPD